MLLLTSIAVNAAAQTFEINGQPAPPQEGPQKKKSQQNGPPSGALGWGTSIDVARQARAAESALKRGDAASAANYALNAAKAAPQNAKLWFLAGYASRLAGRMGASVDAYQRGLNREPNSAEGLSGLAQTYARMGKFNEAQQILTRLIAADPKRWNELLIAGEIFLQSGEYAQAIQMLTRSEQVRPNPRAELLLASAYVRSGQPQRAKQYIDAAVQRDPRNPEIQRALAGYYRETKDYAKSIAVLKRIAGKNPDLLAELAYTYELAKDMKGTAEYYQRAALAAPENIGLQLNAAQAFVRLPDYDKAQRFLAAARAIDPNHYRLHSTLADISRAEGRNGDAVKEYQAALAAAPENPAEGPLFKIQLRSNMTELLRDSGEMDSARAEAQTALAAINAVTVSTAQKFDYYRLRATIQAILGDYGAAEADVKQAIAADPSNPNIMLQYGQLLWRMERRPQARDAYARALQLEPNNRFALSSLGFLAREMNQPKLAEQYFTRLAKAYPGEYTAYLALGDLYAAERNFKPAQANYERAYRLNPKHPLIVAGGANVGVESKDLDLAKTWLDRADARMNEHPFVMRERERYLTWKGDYLESARLGYQVIEKLPRDRDAVVYLGYDLLNLGRYDDLLELTAKYEPLLPKEAALPLLAGYVQRKSDLFDQAEAAFSRAIERDPKVTTAYINRGYVYNELQNPVMAARDFSAALKLEPNNGEANLGLAYAYLQQRKPTLVLESVEQAAKALGESKATHLARAGGYRQRLMLGRAEDEYRKALASDPENQEAQVALAEVLFSQRKYDPAIRAYQNLLPLVDDPSLLYANMAKASAKLRRDDDAMRYIAAAEKTGGDQSAVLLATGDTLLDLNHSGAAMDRFRAALEAPDSTRVDVRLAFARTFLQQGKYEDARQQIALAFAESRVGESEPVLPEHLVEAAGMFSSMNDHDLALRYYEMARQAGADERPVAIGMANTYLAEGRSREAEAMLRSIGSYQENAGDFDYMMAYATLNRQTRNNQQAIYGFARAHELSALDTTAERALWDVAAEEGRPISRNLSLSTDFQVAPIFEDATVYQLDARLFGLTSGSPNLPLPRSSTETIARSDFHIKLGNFPLPLLGTYQFRNARGQTSFPSVATILDRNTFDNTFGFGINPVLRLGRASLFLNPGLQFTIRRDENVPADLNQNLFRQQIYFATSSLFNWMTVRGYGIREGGSFTERDVHSTDYAANLEFVVGRPWGKNALITGYRVRDLNLDPVAREYFSTSTYAGYQRTFGKNLKATFLGEYIRAWRVEARTYSLAQAMRPAAEVAYQRGRWGFEGKFALTRGQGFHDYDNMQSGFLISYTRPWRRFAHDGIGNVGVEFPMRFAVGLQQQSFFNFTGDKSSSFVPVIKVTLF
jgi:tetratricopeptide (TPR) repeat protein